MGDQPGVVRLMMAALFQLGPVMFTTAPVSVALPVPPPRRMRTAQAYRSLTSCALVVGRRWRWSPATAETASTGHVKRWYGRTVFSGKALVLVSFQ
jgi:hypothetical protein